MNTYSYDMMILIANGPKPVIRSLVLHTHLHEHLAANPEGLSPVR